MFCLSPQSVIWVATQPVDFRKGITGLIAVCQQQLSQDPLQGAVFLFYNKPRVSLKILCFDGQGFWLLTKRLSQGRFKSPGYLDKTRPAYKICYRILQTLIHNGDPIAARFSKNWKAVV
jgi:transposase